MYGDRRRARRSTRTSSTTSHGYEGAKPVRIGNGAYDQQQHDVWGALLDSIYLHTKSRDELPESLLADPRAARSRRRSTHWREPDRGIWEVRGEPQHFTSSKVMCWVACDRGARLARLREDARAAPSAGRRAADEIHADVCEHGVDERGVFVQHYDDRRARRLAACCCRSCASCRPTTSAIRATVLAIADELTDRRARAALPGRGDRRRPQRRGGHVHDLLVLARQRAGRDRRDDAGARAVREAARLRVAAAASTPRRSTRARAATSATSRRRSRTWR